MAQLFSFGFNDDDIDDEGGERNEMEVDDGIISLGEEPPLVEPRLHSLEEMVGYSLYEFFHHGLLSAVLQ